MIGIANSKVQANHVVLQSHARIQRSWPGMVAQSAAHPCNACSARFVNGQLCGLFHDQMAHAVIAINQSHGRSFLNHFDIRI